MRKQKGNTVQERLLDWIYMNTYIFLIGKTKKKIGYRLKCVILFHPKLILKSYATLFFYIISHHS